MLGLLGQAACAGRRLENDTRRLPRDHGISTEVSLAVLMMDLIKRLLVRISLFSCLLSDWACVVLEDQFAR